MIDGEEWPTFGWVDDIRANLAEAHNAGRPVVIGTLYKVEGSAPRGPGAQMLFDEARAFGYFSGDCIEGDVARHAADVLQDGQPQHLHYGMGSPWIDIRLRCGGALYILVERVSANDPAVADLLDAAARRQQCVWRTDGVNRGIRTVTDAPLLEYLEDGPQTVIRRYDPPRRLIVSGGDPGALALAALGPQARFETILLRPGGPETPPPFPGVTYLREEPASAIRRIGMDRWTAYVGATHEDEHDLGGCLAALQGGAGYVGMIGAKSRTPGRKAALEAAGATQRELDELRFRPGIPGLGKAPWEVATGIMAEIMQTLNPMAERA